MEASERNLSLTILAVISIVIVVGGFRLNNKTNTSELNIGLFYDTEITGSSEDMYEYYKTLVNRFEEKYPDIKVTCTSGIPGSEYSEWLTNAMLRGKEPDAFLVMSDDFEMLANSGALERLDEHMRSDYTFDRDIYYEPALESGRYNGDTYALPISCVPKIMFVNKTLLADNNIEIPDDNWTWDDFYDICKRISATEGNYGVYGYYWRDAVCSNGVSVFSKDGRKCDLTNEQVQSAIRFQKKLEELNNGYSVASRDFDLGRVAFRPFSYSEYRAYQPYPWRVKKYTSFEWDGIQMPAGPNGDNVSELDTLLMGVSAHSDNKDMAWEFVSMCSADEETQKGFYAYLRGVSPIKSIAENDMMVDTIMEDMPGERVFDRHTINRIMSKAVVTPRFEGYEQADNMVDKIITQEIENDQFEESLLLSEQRKINKFLSKQ